MEQTRPAFYKIFVADLERASDFYRQCLGFTEKRRIDAGALDEVILTPSMAGAALVLCRWKDGRDLEPGNANGPTGFYVTKIEAALERMVARGAAISLEPVMISGHRIAVASDPDGHRIELIQMQT